MKTKCGAYVNQLLDRMDGMFKGEHHETIVHLRKCMKNSVSNIKMLNKKCGPQVWAAMVKCNHDLPIEWAPFGRKEAAALHAEMELMANEDLEDEILDTPMEDNEEAQYDTSEESSEESSDEPSEESLVEEVEEVEEEEEEYEE